MRWAKKKDGSRRLVVVDEFHSYVRPTFQPILHAFCTELTGVTQVSNLISTVTGIDTDAGSSGQLAYISTRLGAL
jgi:hypothetical protein